MSKRVAAFNNTWKRWHKRQVNHIHNTHSPLTDLMDNEQSRMINECLLKYLQISIGGNKHNNETSPFALKCLQRAYRKNREDNLFAKNVQFLLSRFQIAYVIEGDEKKDAITCEGILILNVNADNSIATNIVTLHFKDLSAEKVILLKHVFYKRLLVNIREYENPNQSPLVDCSVCSSFECLMGNLSHHNEQTTIQDYINRKFCCYYQPSMLEFDVDYRARYSFLELHNNFPRINNDLDSVGNISLIRQMYGMLKADEGYNYVPVKKCRKAFSENTSSRNGYSMYIYGLNAIIITHYIGDRKRCKKEHGYFENRYREDLEHIHTEAIEGLCIPGVWEEYFPSFLKSAEIHYLINKITTNEIIVHDRSYIYPWIFIKRLISLWGILYELDSHKYHINKGFHDALGISEQLDLIRQEYNSLLTYTLSYCMAIIAAFTAIFTIMQLWK